MIIDMRCPCCNQPVQGREEVIIRAKMMIKAPKSCQNCTTPLTVREYEEYGQKMAAFYPAIEERT